MDAVIDAARVYVVVIESLVECESLPLPGVIIVRVVELEAVRA